MANSTIPAPDHNDPGSLWHNLKKQLGSALDKFDRAEVELEKAQMTMAEIERAKRPDGTLPPDAVAAAERNRGYERAEEAMAWEAAQGATSVQALRADDGDTKFIINGLRAVVLSPMLSALLMVLLADNGTSPDEFVSWKSRSEAQHRLKQRTGRGIKRGALNNLVHRLRRAIHKQGLHRNFIHSDGRLGLRFALRRRVAA